MSTSQRPMAQPETQRNHASREAGTGLAITDLAKAIGTQRVLDGIDLDVPSGQLVTVLGPSGSGKTTLLRLICGFERADAGRIRLGGRIMTDGARRHVPPERRGVGYVAQEGALFPHLDVRRNIEFGLSRRQRATYNVGRLLDAVGLPAHYADRAPAALSGGEQQRVALARALAPGPRLVLLDEPFSSLDAGLRAATRKAAAASLKQAGATAVLVTHDQDEALSMGDRVAVLQNGRLAQVAAPQTLYAYPASPAIARFVGEAVLVAGTLAGDAVDCCFGRLPVASAAQTATRAGHGNVDVLIRPEQFRLGTRLVDTDAPPGSAATQTARVEQLSFYGHDARIVLRTHDGQVFTATIPGFDLPSVGQEVYFRVTGKVIAYPRDSG